MHTRSTLRTIVVGFSVLCAAAAPAQTEPIVTTDLLKIRSVSSIDVSRDGTKAVVAVRSIHSEPAGEGEDAEPTYANRSHLYLLDLTDDAAPPRQLTFGDRRDGDPRFSPDGQGIAFVRRGEDTTGDDDDGGGGAQIWILDLRGGEALQLTSMEHGASSPRWSPNGRRLLVSSSIPMSKMEGTPPWSLERPNRSWKDSELPEGQAARPEGTREQIRAWLEKNASDRNPSVINRIAFQGEQGLRREMTFSQLFVVNVDQPDGDPNRDGSRLGPPAEPVQLTNAFFDHGQHEWMPDGQSIVYAAAKDPSLHPDRRQPNALYRINADGANDRLVLALDGFTLGSPTPSPDGSMLAFNGEQTDQPAHRQTQLGLVALDNDGSGGAGEPVWMIEESTFPGSVWSFVWSPTRMQLLFTSGMRGGVPLLAVSPGLIEPAPILDEMDGFPAGVQDFDIGGGTTVCAVTTPRNPCVLYAVDVNGAREVMDLNEWVADKRLSMPREGTITRPDGTIVQYWFMEPTQRDADLRYPMVLEIHGGPSAMWGPGEFTMWHEFQLLCSWGYAVVYANPRGSGGYGYEFQRANYQNWGDGPAGDVLAVVDQALIDHPWVDPERMVVTGGSYAGYLTAWIVGHDHRFQAAAAQRGVYDLETFFGEGNAWRLVEFAFGGYPWDQRYTPIIDRESPFTYVQRIRTPLLIMHASQDLRTGVSQSEMLYRALKELNKPVEYVRYPGAGHDLSRTGDPKQRLDRLNRIVEFFERHIENPRPAPMIE